MEGVIIVISMFIVVFGIAYLHFTTRHKERLALIEKGTDASIFFGKNISKTSPVWKIIILNLALLSMGIGAGIFLGSMLEISGFEENAIYPAMIFLMGGLGLLIGFFITKKMDNEP
ncbi:DUF6249 domain-containing protein [Xanthovirga aplysinae]|uniref:DUF6249 domain-containing protein n=1 Tax=Xanthovirga aplysinae TaxID=2529853 RepID=UPI0012BC0C5E|nr:DUF6249 domain-containing protein [Xanthovirga aplysinae]MTI32148.1 hypothetical protein [Xanthovirga aplysinae]